MAHPQAVKWVVKSTGETTTVNPWDGIKVETTPSGQLCIGSETLPSAACMFFPVFVTEIGIEIDVINFMLEESWPDIESSYRSKVENHGVDVRDLYVERLMFPQERDPKLMVFPTEWPLNIHDITFPFLGKSFSDVFAAWVGKDGAALEDGALPFRSNDGRKPRHWSDLTFLVLDSKTMERHYEPTALVAYLDSSSSDEKDVEFIRCDFPVCLIFLRMLESEAYDMQYYRDHIMDEDGVVRYRKFKAWFKRGGPADQEMEAYGKEKWMADMGSRQRKTQQTLYPDVLPMSSD